MSSWMLRRVRKNDYEGLDITEWYTQNFKKCKSKAKEGKKKKLPGLSWRMTILREEEKYDCGKRWINVGQQIYSEASNKWCPKKKRYFHNSGKLHQVLSVHSYIYMRTVYKRKRLTFETLSCIWCNFKSSKDITHPSPVLHKKMKYDKW
jgi:hypothetical protein